MRSPIIPPEGAIEQQRPTFTLSRWFLIYLFYCSVKNIKNKQDQRSTILSNPIQSYIMYIFDYTPWCTVDINVSGEKQDTLVPLAVWVSEPGEIQGDQYCWHSPHLDCPERSDPFCTTISNLFNKPLHFNGYSQPVRHDAILDNSSLTLYDRYQKSLFFICKGAEEYQRWYVRWQFI